MSGRSHSLVRRRIASTETLALSLLIPVILVLATLHLASYPLISGWDEGIYLQFAANLAQHGEYATRDGTAFNRLTPVGGTGITLIAPVALALHTWPESLVAARLVVTIALALLLLVAYLLVRKLANWRAACAALVLLLVAGHTTYDTLWVGRQVLAEVPALALLLGGVWTWIQSWRRGTAWLYGCSALLVAAIVTKNQFIWVIGPVFALLALADACYYHQLGWRQRLAPLIAAVCGVGGWTVISFWIVGARHWPHYLESQRLLSAATYLHVDVHRWAANARLLYTSGQVLPLLAGLGYVAYRSRARTTRGLQHATLLALTGVALAFFGVLNLPWARYLYPPLAFAALCDALLLDALARWASARQRILSHGAAVALLVAALAGPRLARDTQLIVNPDAPDAADFAALLDHALAPDATALNWEWELEFYSPHAFIHPSGQLFAALVDETYNRRRGDLLAQPRIPPAAHYLVIGPFAEQTHVFDSDLAVRPHQLVVTRGPYRLYHLGAP